MHTFFIDFIMQCFAPLDFEDPFEFNSLNDIDDNKENIVYFNESMHVTSKLPKKNYNLLQKYNIIIKMCKLKFKDFSHLEISFDKVHIANESDDTIKEYGTLDYTNNDTRESTNQLEIEGCVNQHTAEYYKMFPYIYYSKSIDSKSIHTIENTIINYFIDYMKMKSRN